MGPFDFRIVSLLGLGLLVSGGCTGESGPERRVVTGRVTYQGEAVPSGEIRVAPLGDGPVSAAKITNGEFEIAHRGGVVTGPAKVMIVAVPSDDGASQDELDRGGNPPKTIAIPEKYNRESVLQTEIESGEGKQTIDFDLT
ncbi:hypothetical protein Pla52o_15610 [Novipirellula galeiformis]|uniref:Carboxypeptidase regulatory-like domain-containing protein n=1 Tax=Novipirellula galeiformis TaxID=2528004 RepID=A0A5C6CK71_9BACT|nr:hypothetical protein [Novipirellula galeiformis]TWU25263.1 hypothetical protein Pla52o_15610 [Novipirellula galeiformis]